MLWGKKVYLFGVDEAIEKLPRVIASDKKYFLISKKIHQLAEVKKAGIDFGDEIIFGTSSKTKDAKEVYSNIYLLEKDIEDRNYLDSEGIELVFKLTPDEKGLTWNNIKKTL